MRKVPLKTHQLGLHQAKLPSNQLGNQSGQPQNRNPQTKPQPAKHLQATQSESPVNKFQPKTR